MEHLYFICNYSVTRAKKNSESDNYFDDFCERAEYFLFCVLMYDTLTVFLQSIFIAYSFLRVLKMNVLT